MSTTFFYRARTPEGARISGAVNAENAAAVVDHLRARALFITGIDPAATVGGRLAALQVPRSLGAGAMLALLRSLATLVQAGVPIQRAIGVVAAQTQDRRLREALRAILADVEAGRSLSDAMRRRPRDFSALHVAMIEAGENGGLLDEILERLAALLERDDALRKRLTAALAYPAIVLVAATTLTAFLIATIVPTFGRMFAELGAPLPASTRLLLAIGELFSGPAAGVRVGGGLTAIVAATLLLHSSRRFQAAWDWLAVRLPIVGAIARGVTVARIARSLGSLLQVGVDVLRAIELTAPTAGNREYAVALMRVRDGVREGAGLAAQLTGTKLFDPLLLQLLWTGEESGCIDAMLLRAAEHYDREVAAATVALGAVLEPMLIGVAGLAVGSIVYAIFVPLYSLVGQIR